MNEYCRQKSTASGSEFSQQQPQRKGCRRRNQIYFHVDQPEQKGNDYSWLSKRGKDQN
jgi:hypothetical protein